MEQIKQHAQILSLWLFQKVILTAIKQADMYCASWIKNYKELILHRDTNDVSHFLINKSMNIITNTNLYHKYQQQRSLNQYKLLNIVQEFDPFQQYHHGIFQEKSDQLLKDYFLPQYWSKYIALRNMIELHNMDSLNSIIFNEHCENTETCQMPLTVIGAAFDFFVISLVEILGKGRQNHIKSIANKFNDINNVDIHEDPIFIILDFTFTKLDEHKDFGSLHVECVDFVDICHTCGIIHLSVTRQSTDVICDPHRSELPRYDGPLFRKSQDITHNIPNELIWQIFTFLNESHILHILYQINWSFRELFGKYLSEIKKDSRMKTEQNMLHVFERTSQCIYSSHYRPMPMQLFCEKMCKQGICHILAKREKELYEIECKDMLCDNTLCDEDTYSDWNNNNNDNNYSENDITEEICYFHSRKCGICPCCGDYYN